MSPQALLRPEEGAGTSASELGLLAVGLIASRQHRRRLSRRTHQRRAVGDHKKPTRKPNGPLLQSAATPARSPAKASTIAANIKPAQAKTSAATAALVPRRRIALPISAELTPKLER